MENENKERFYYHVTIHYADIGKTLNVVSKRDEICLAFVLEDLIPPKYTFKIRNGLRKGFGWGLNDRDLFKLLSDRNFYKDFHNEDRFFRHDVIGVFGFPIATIYYPEYNTTFLQFPAEYLAAVRKQMEFHSSLDPLRIAKTGTPYLFGYYAVRPAGLNLWALEKRRLYIP